jgi:CheY-like chemotaxis protein
VKRHGLLIVDDEQEILRSLTLTFAGDHEVFAVSSGTEALALLARQDIALIIADQRMPEMTGAELLERAIEINPNAIRMILTGYTDTAAWCKPSIKATSTSTSTNPGIGGNSSSRSNWRWNATSWSWKTSACSRNCRPPTSA